jgi:dCTP deaminase
VLETGCVYLVPLQESLKLPKDLSAAANPKSSTGRIDVFVRAVSDRARAFDGVPAGYTGDLYAEISPRTFSVLARTGDRLLQLRVRRGPQTSVRDMTFSLDLFPTKSDIVGYRAKRHSRVIDLAAIGAHVVEDFWEPVRARGGRIVLDPGEFYILASKEKIVIPLDEAAEMAPIAPELGEFRAHYAGFFDPGFGVTHSKGKAVLEVRSRDVPFILEDGQPVGRLVFEKLTSKPDVPYGAAGSYSTYAGQGLRLSKYFAKTVE